MAAFFLGCNRADPILAAIPHDPGMSPDLEGRMAILSPARRPQARRISTAARKRRVAVATITTTTARAVVVVAGVAGAAAALYIGAILLMSADALIG